MARPRLRHALISFVFNPNLAVMSFPSATRATRALSSDCCIRACKPQYVIPKVSKNVARALFCQTAFLVPSARGANGFLHLFHPARIMACASARFLAAILRKRSAANGCSHASACATASKTFFLTLQEILHEAIKFVSDGTVNQVASSKGEMAPY